MTISVAHTKVSSVADGADASLVRPSDWNAEHTVSGTVDATYFTPDTVTKTTGGAVSGTVAGVQTMLDGSVYSVVETTGVPGFDIRFDWATVTQTPTHVILRQRYDGTASHVVTIDLWNYATSAWVVVHQIVTDLEYQVIEIPIPSFTDFISSEAVKLRVYHITSGSVSHTQYFDYVGLKAGGSLGSMDGDKGGVTVSSSGAIWAVNDKHIAYAKMQDVSATDMLLGRSSAGAGVVQEIACTAAGRALIDDATAAAQRTTLGLGTAAVNNQNLVYVKAGANTAVNDTNDVTIATYDATGVAAGDSLLVDAWFTIYNSSTATRAYVVTLDFDALFDVELTTGASADSATLMQWCHVYGVCDVRANNLVYAMTGLDMQIAAGVAGGGDTTALATHLSAKGWGTSTSDATGTLTVTLKVRSANSTATQTLRLHRFTVTKNAALSL